MRIVMRKKKGEKKKKKKKHFPQRRGFTSQWDTPTAPEPKEGQEGKPPAPKMDPEVVAGAWDHNVAKEKVSPKGGQCQPGESGTFE